MVFSCFERKTCQTIEFKRNYRTIQSRITCTFVILNGVVVKSEFLLSSEMAPARKVACRAPRMRRYRRHLTLGDTH